MKVRVIEVELDGPFHQQAAMVTAVLKGSPASPALLPPAPPAPPAAPAHLPQPDLPTPKAFELKPEPSAISQQAVTAEATHSVQADEIFIPRPTGRAEFSRLYGRKWWRLPSFARLKSLTAWASSPREVLSDPFCLFCISASSVCLVLGIGLFFGLDDWIALKYAGLMTETELVQEPLTEANPTEAEQPTEGVPIAPPSDASDKAGIHGDRPPMRKGVAE